MDTWVNSPFLRKCFIVIILPFFVQNINLNQSINKNNQFVELSNTYTKQNKIIISNNNQEKTRTSSVLQSLYQTNTYAIYTSTQHARCLSVCAGPYVAIP